MSEIKVKKCCKCKLYLTLDNFIKNKRSKDGHYHYCKSCNKNKKKTQYEKNKEKIKKQTRDYRQANLQQIRNRDKRYRRENTERKLLKESRYRAKKRNLEFNLTIEDILIPSICPIMGIEIFVGDGKMCHNSPTLDRIDSKKGYIKGNVRVISQRANNLKSDSSFEEIEKLYLNYFNQYCRV